MIRNSFRAEEKPIVLWQPILSPHQTPLLEELAKQWNASILLVVDREIAKGREEGSGWKIEQPKGISVTTNGSLAPAGAIHIVSGFHGTELWRQNRRRIIRSKESAIWVMAESLGNWDHPAKIILRFFRHGIASLLIGKKLSGFLSIGESAASQARLFGVARNKIFPFCYVTSLPDSRPVALSQKTTKPFVLFLGEISKRKGVDVLFRTSLSDVAQLQVIGKHADKDIQIPDEVEYLGVIPNLEVSQFIQSADVLVLPSRFDGWGAVINEALMVGTPVVCTSACGGSTLLRTANPKRGEVVSELSVQNLENSIREVLKSEFDREAISGWSKKNISPVPVAAYLKSLLSGDARIAPWMEA